MKGVQSSKTEFSVPLVISLPLLSTEILMIIGVNGISKKLPIADGML